MRHVALGTPKRRRILFPLLVVVAVVVGFLGLLDDDCGAIAYGVNDPVGAAQAVKAVARSVSTFVHALAT